MSELRPSVQTPEDSELPRTLRVQQTAQLEVPMLSVQSEAEEQPEVAYDLQASY